MLFGISISTYAADPVLHSHDGRQHTHLLPVSGVNHKHNLPKSTPQSRKSVNHAHNGRYHAHILPDSGINHSHNRGTKTVKIKSDVTPIYLSDPKDNLKTERPVADPDYNRKNIERRERASQLAFEKLKAEQDAREAERMKENEEREKKLKRDKVEIRKEQIRLAKKYNKGMTSQEREQFLAKYEESRRKYLEKRSHEKRIISTKHYNLSDNVIINAREREYICTTPHVSANIAMMFKELEELRSKGDVEAVVLEVSANEGALSTILSAGYCSFLNNSLKLPVIEENLRANKIITYKVKFSDGATGYLSRF